jgi:phosphoglycolate phosphatase-like HAD superfamily hydrolase
MAATHPAVLFDVDGTLLDTNYQHVVAWEQAFRDAGHADVDMADIHRRIGRSSAELVEDILGESDDDVVEGHTKRYAELRQSLEPRVVRGAADLVTRCGDAGLRVVLATSGGEHDLEWMVPALGVGDRLDGITTSSKVDASKPAPDLLAVAAEENDIDLGRCALVGDTVWDVAAATRLGIPCVAMTSGGIGAAELREAGAAEVWGNCRDLLDHWEESLLSRLA